MTRERYLKLKEFLKQNKTLLYILAAAQKLFELAAYISYPLFLLMLIINKNLYCIQSVAVCGIGFVLVTVFRKYVNAERPYERFGFSPVIKKERKGCSFPSRHVFSAAVIGMSLLPVYPIWGVTILVSAVIMGALRVTFGLHFIKDVSAGLAAGLIFGLFSFI